MQQVPVGLWDVLCSSSYRFPGRGFGVNSEAGLSKGRGRTVLEVVVHLGSRLFQCNSCSEPANES